MITISLFRNLLCKTMVCTSAFVLSVNISVPIIQSSTISVLPKTVNELHAFVSQARAQKQKIALVGAGKSQGGQTYSSQPNVMRISLEKLDKVVAFNVEEKTITVQAGMTWRQLQEHIAPYKLAIKAMQSYNDFSIGGSLSVNVHGQDFHSGPLIKTVLSFKLMLASGDILNISRTENAELFGLALGGYGLFGVITQVTLSLTDDILLERRMHVVSTKNLVHDFLTNIYNNPSIEFHSARFSINSKELLKEAIVITYEKHNQENEVLFALEQPRIVLWTNHIMASVKNFAILKEARFFVENLLLKKSEIISRNNFMNYTIQGLPQDGKNSYYILQEYFIPYNNVKKFLSYLCTIVNQYSINLLNVTARHVNQDDESVLNYASSDCCALVLYCNCSEDPSISAETWTRTLIDKALALEGCYYLPYHLFATKAQVQKAYPRFTEFINKKRRYDPQELFTNRLYEKYVL